MPSRCRRAADDIVAQIVTLMMRAEGLPHRSKQHPHSPGLSSQRKADGVYPLMQQAFGLNRDDVHARVGVYR